MNVYKNPALQNDSQSNTLRKILQLVYIFGDPIQSILAVEDLFVTKSVTELLWGYEDPVFMAIKEKASGFSSFTGKFGLQVSCTFACVHTSTIHVVVESKFELLFWGCSQIFVGIQSPYK